MFLSQIAAAFQFPNTAEGWIFEAIGIVASMFVFFSFFWSNEKKTRIINMVGCIVFVVYAILIGSLSVMIMNGACLVLHIVKLVQMHQKNKKEKKSDDDTSADTAKKIVLEKLHYDLTVCKVKSELDINLNNGFYFIGKTDEEISLVCVTADTPRNTVEREDGWKCFRIQGTLDFSLTGILSGISAVLAENKIGIFAVSTFNTDYILVKKENFEKSINLLSLKGYSIV